MKRNDEENLQQWHHLPSHWHTVVATQPDSVLLQTSRFDASNRNSFIFLNPVQTISAHRLDEIPKLFCRIEESLAEGFYVAGFLCYECGYHFERVGNLHLVNDDLPLAWFGIYRKPLIFDHAAGYLDGNAPISEAPSFSAEAEHFESVNLVLGKQAYCEKIETIKEYIRQGDTYQVNFTSSVEMPSQEDTAATFTRLLRQQPVAYSALLNISGHQILSLSPELFFRTEDGKITTRPMKGTMRRGLDLAEDRQAAINLQNDEKNRSEHLMIVDLLRNDLGRICNMGSVQVEDLFSIEHYRTLLQMTSTVSGKLRTGLHWYDIFKAMFPSGSITGAPKIRTMQIIRELEENARGIYTGAIGYIAPDGSSAFNVAIRTLHMRAGKISMGVGGGIVADSIPDEEYSECLLKAAFLTHQQHDFQLIETMLWNGDFRLLSMHMDRLESSAAYFEFAFDRAAAVSQLREYASSFSSEKCYRVRLLLNSDGKIILAHGEHSNQPAAISNVRIALQRTFSNDVFLRHKTTLRQQYDLEYAQCRRDGFDEVIFQNERGEITEGSISNIFIRREGRLVTPPLHCGVLPGIFRRHLLEDEPRAKEAVLTLRDLQTADAIYICNSLRGMREIRLAPDLMNSNLYKKILTAPDS
ncbi:MAG TPA: aminodeoxychorismate synthase component I [Edaphobacter sp.]|nr:aminodeoxychorismate synthase component I [Edaphobacter sp.]